jgi:arylsulfatase A-like enzyme
MTLPSAVRKPRQAATGRVAAATAALLGVLLAAPGCNPAPAAATGDAPATSKAPPAGKAPATTQAPTQAAAAESADLPPLPKEPPPPHPDWKREINRWLASAPPAAEPFQVQATEPHPIFFIYVDALRPDHMSLHGYPRETTPNLDALAAEGLTFTTFYANAPWTRPSTTSFLTGLNTSRHRVQCEQHRLNDRYLTIPEALKQAGYRTAGILANGNGGSIANLQQGFDHYLDPRWFRNELGLRSLPKAHHVVDAALQWVERNRRHDKLFMFMFIVDPHDPYRGPTPEAERRWLWEGHPEPVRIPRWEYPEGQGLTADQRRATIAAYDSAVRYSDEQLGRFFERLKALGVYDKATIIVTADHGDGFGEHGFYKHAHHHWDEVVRVPFIIKSPAIPASAHGRSVDMLSQKLDVFPTVARLAGAQATIAGRNLPGMDLLTAMANPSAHDGRRIFGEYNCFGISRTMMRTRTHKLILQLPANEEEFMSTVTRKDLLPSVIFDREELVAFRLESDPLEHANVVPGTDPARAPEDVAPLLEELRAFIGEQPGGRATLVEEMDPAIEENLRALGYIQ